MHVQPKGHQEIMDLVAFYKENVTILKEAFRKLTFEVHGGENAPYVWVAFPGRASWDIFGEILKQCNIVTTPGAGFGPSGEGFVRASAFCHRYASDWIMKLPCDMQSMPGIPNMLSCSCLRQRTQAFTSPLLA